MNGTNRNPAVWLAALVILTAAASWGSFFLRTVQPDESSLRDTDGIEITIDGSNQASTGILVDCMVTNHTDRIAESVVFTAALMNSEGIAIAANPLGNVLALQPRESRKTHIVVPTPDNPEHEAILPNVTVNLVRWQAMSPDRRD